MICNIGLLQFQLRNHWERAVKVLRILKLEVNLVSVNKHVEKQFLLLFLLSLMIKKFCCQFQLCYVEKKLRLDFFTMMTTRMVSKNYKTGLLERLFMSLFNVLASSPTKVDVDSTIEENTNQSLPKKSKPRIAEIRSLAEGGCYFLF